MTTQNLSLLRREMDRFFDGFWPTNAEADWSPACEVEEALDHYTLTMDVPGVQKDEIKLEVIDNHVFVSGERKQEEKKKLDGGWYSERSYGRFHRSFQLPSGVDADKVEANYQDGILRVKIPKVENAKPKLIKIAS